MALRQQLANHVLVARSSDRWTGEATFALVILVGVVVVVAQRSSPSLRNAFDLSPVLVDRFEPILSRARRREQIRVRRVHAHDQGLASIVDQRRASSALRGAAYLPPLYLRRHQERLSFFVDRQLAVHHRKFPLYIDRG
ncbi:MAG: hypothetical protein E6J91_00665 [Deltaproteobacteria bacterium]|nr:MAG: hypothetical protein E6J91_00665 [Deltaproteobacteria bacterium]